MKLIRNWFECVFFIITHCLFMFYTALNFFFSLQCAALLWTQPNHNINITAALQLGQITRGKRNNLLNLCNLTHEWIIKSSCKLVQFFLYQPKVSVLRSSGVDHSGKNRDLQIFLHFINKPIISSLSLKMSDCTFNLSQAKYTVDLI